MQISSEVSERNRQYKVLMENKNRCFVLTTVQNGRAQGPILHNRDFGYLLRKGRQYVDQKMADSFFIADEEGHKYVV